jgi:hypothetical protein
MAQMNIADESACRKPMVGASRIDHDEWLVMICAPAVARPAVRMGMWGGTERCEDGADDHR